ncbi:DUF1643 domain-containing protein [Bradyrhizobium manausense]|nr:DUF1643 domain-containing protein [Bradyrhizobium manausense]
MSELTQLNFLTRGSAIISACGTYRYELRRIWNDSKPPCVLGMLNPSTADAEIDDPTITRCVRRAAASGFGSLIVWNLGAGRATDPKVWKQMRDPIGPQNSMHIRRILVECRERKGLALVGWGAHGSHMGCAEIAIAIANEVGVILHCLGVTKDGQPKHPLYVGYSEQPVRWKLCRVEKPER